MSEQLDRLGRQLDAIELAMTAARTEPDPDRRDHLLGVAERATQAARKDYEQAAEEEHRRPVLRILKGGAIGTAAAGSLEWLRHARDAHPHAGPAVLAAAVTLAAAIAYVSNDHNTDSTPPLASPPLTAPSSTGSTPTAPTTTTPQPSRRSTPPGPATTRRPGPRRPPGALQPASQVSPPPPPVPPTTGSTQPGATPPPTTTPPTTPPPAIGPPPTTPPPPATVPPSPPGGLCLILDLHPILGLDLCLGTHA